VLLCLAAALAPFVLPAVPIGADLPKHLFVARVYSAYDDPSFRFPEYFELNPRPVPTFLVTFLLALAMKVVAPFTAAKLFLVASTLGFWYFARGMFRAAGAPASAALLVLPLSNSGFVFSGYVGYNASVAFYPALLWILVSRLRGAARFCAITASLLVLYGFHIVGWAIGCMTVAVFAVAPLAGLEPGEPRRRGIRWLDLAAPLVTVPLFLFFSAPSSQSYPSIWYGPLGQIKALIAYTAMATTRPSAIPMLAGILALLAASLWCLWRRAADRRLFLIGGLLLVAGLLLPWEYGNWSPVAPRVLPPALIAIAGGLRFSLRGWRIAALSAVLVMMPLCALNTRAVLAEQITYREFMAGIPSVAYGSRILPVIENWGGGWNALTSPHFGMEDTYNLARGGTNPMMYAYPDLKTGAYLLTYRQAQPDSGYKWDRHLDPHLEGSSRHSDYVVLFGFQGQREVLAREMDLCYAGGRLAVFGRRGACLR
jgi:hypothetical protein